MDKIKSLFKNIYFVVFLLAVILLVILLLMAILTNNATSTNSDRTQTSSTNSTNLTNSTNSTNLTNSTDLTDLTSSTTLVASKKTFANKDELNALIKSTEFIDPKVRALRAIPLRQSNLSPTNSPPISTDSTNLTDSTNNDLSLLTDLLKILLNTNIPGNLTSNPSPTSPPNNNNERASHASPLHKTGIFILSNYSDGAKKIVNAKPKIIKIMDPQQNADLLQAAKDFKNANPDGINVLRIYQGTQNKKYSLNDNPVTMANEFFQSVIGPALNSLGDDKKYFDYIETPNELDNTPGWETNNNVVWLSKFWEKLIELDSQVGIRTCIASIPVGNPPGSREEIKSKMQSFSSALSKAVINNGAFCYHAYSLNYTTDVNQEIYSSLRYRTIHEVIGEIDPGFSTLDFILSEAGIDRAGNPQTSGWQLRGDGTQYTNWITWFDREMNKDAYVLGATLFQIGDSNWSSFDLEPIAGWIAGSI